MTTKYTRFPPHFDVRCGDEIKTGIRWAAVLCVLFWKDPDLMDAIISLVGRVAV